MGPETPPQRLLTPANSEGFMTTDEGSDNSVEQKNKLPTLYFGEYTRSSEKHPDRNEDRMFFIEEGALGVFDGLGSKKHKGSEEAAEIASNETKELFEKYIGRVHTKEDAEDLVEDALIISSEQILKKNFDKEKNIRTTGAIGFLWQDDQGDTYFTHGHVGDSRIYLFNKLEGLNMLTLDHNIAREEIFEEELEKEELKYDEIYDKVKKIQLKLDNYTGETELTDDERRFLENRNKIAQTLGDPSCINPDIKTIKLEPGDRILALTDGISDNLTHEDIRRILEEYTNNKQALEELIKQSVVVSKMVDNPRSKYDDMAIVIMQFGGEEGPYKTLALKM